MANRGYDVVVDVDAEGDLGHTDLQEDNLEFHSSNFNDPSTRSKIPSDTSTPFINANSSSGAPSKRFLWSLSFYAQFFDVDTSEVLRRCTSSLYPRAPFLDILDGNPDLYGPFWIATTVVFILFITGTVSQYLSTNIQKDDSSASKAQFEYNFSLLSGAAGLIYGYTLFVPVGLWGALKWFGAESATLVECWALYGYANCIWVPVSLLSWSRLTALNYVAVTVGYLWSVAFLARNLWPVVSVTEAKISRVLVLLVVILHFGLAVAIKFTVFGQRSTGGGKADATPPAAPTPTVTPPAETPADEGAEKMIRALFGI